MEVIATDLDALRPALAVTTAPAPELPSASTPTTSSEPRVTHRKIGTMGIVGASLLGAGFATVVPGIVLTAIGDSSTVNPDDPLRVEVTQRRTPGLVLVGVGAAAMIVGATLLGVDVARRSKANAAKPYERLA